MFFPFSEKKNKLAFMVSKATTGTGYMKSSGMQDMENQINLSDSVCVCVCVCVCVYVCAGLLISVTTGALGRWAGHSWPQGSPDYVYDSGAIIRAGCKGQTTDSPSLCLSHTLTHTHTHRPEHTD